MLKINHFVSRKSQLCYCDLKPGDVFYFSNDPDRIPQLKIKNIPTFGGSMHRHITLSEPWDANTAMLDAQVCMLHAELNVSEIH